MKTKRFISQPSATLRSFRSAASPSRRFLSCLPGPPSRGGGLVISELTASGSVGQLTALNQTDDYLLLTDADVLTGAKQNRVVNRSMLLAPSAKTVIEVSCVERLRWNYRSSSFSTPGSVADPNLRCRKAGTFTRMKPEGEVHFRNTQGEVWDHVHMSLASEGVNSQTESYEELLKHRMSKAERAFPECNPAEGCNGLAVLVEWGGYLGRPSSGTRSRTAIISRCSGMRHSTLSRTSENKDQIDMHEAYFEGAGSHRRVQ